jgi:anti-sigma factor RsiW
MEGDELEGLDQRLRGRLFRISCPSSEELMALLQGGLSVEQRRAVAAHVTTCPHCARELRAGLRVINLRQNPPRHTP